MFSYTKFEQTQVDKVVAFCDTDLITKFADGFGCITSPSHRADGRHTRIVPALHNIFGYELQQFSLAHNGVRHVQSRKLILLRWIDLEFFNKPIVQLAVRNEFERTNAVSDVFNSVALPVRKIVHRVNTPFVFGTVMMCVLDTI